MAGPSRKQVLEKLQQIQELKQEVTAPEESGNFPRATGLSDRCHVKFEDGHEIEVIVGTSEHIQQSLIESICRIVDAAYSGVGKHKRLDQYDAVDRLEMGDAGPQANRVLHLAFKDRELVGCASSTFSPGWTPDGCGHWGLLAVHPDHQKSGVATALVIAAERRLATICGGVQIEYQYTEGDDFSRRLRDWYEGKLKFQGGCLDLEPGQTIFRRCRKSIPAEEQQRGHFRRLEEIEKWLQLQLKEMESKDAASMHTGLPGGYPVTA